MTDFSREAEIIKDSILISVDEVEKHLKKIQIEGLKDEIKDLNKTLAYFSLAFHFSKSHNKAWVREGEEKFLNHVFKIINKEEEND